MGLIRTGDFIGIDLFRYDFFKKLTEKYKISNFVETGTYYGTTIFQLSKYFRNCYTIEASEKIYNHVFNMYKHVKNIKFYKGDSVEILPIVLKEIYGETSVFWLDAHWNGVSVAYGKDNIHPLIKELDIILNIENAPILMIDDFRLICFPGNRSIVDNKWPTLIEVIDKISCSSNKYNIFVAGDILFAVPDLYYEYIIKIIPSDWLYDRDKKKA